MQNTIKKHNICEIDWNACSSQEWQEHYGKIRRANLLQSFEYGQAMARLNNQKIRRGIIKINGNNAGLIQVLEAGIFKNAVHGILLDRTPIWFNDHGNMQEFKLFLVALSKEFPKRFGRRIRFIPEIENTNAAQEILHEYGYKCTSSRSYQTIWLDITPELGALRKKLNPKWRNKLNKAEKNDIKVVFDDSNKHLQWLLQHYAADKALRKYDGAAPKTIIALAGEFSRGQNLLIGTALLAGRPIAAILLFNHGLSSTYQIGYTSDIGRKKCAHHLLLWRAVGELKERNINDFDLGGVNDESAKGVKNFKEGMGGILHETLGLFH